MSVQKIVSDQQIWSIQFLRERVAKKQGEPFWNRIVRSVSIYLTWLLIHTPISANGVTFLFLLAGLVGAGAFTLGTPIAWIAGTLLLWLSILFDFSDGEVARFRQESSWFGDYFEETVHAVLVIAMYCGLSLGVWQRDPANPWPFAFALIAACCTLMARNEKNLLMKSLFQYYGMERLQSIAPAFSLGELVLTRNMSKALYLVDLLIFDFGIYFVVLPIAAIADRMDLFLYFYGVVRLLSVIYMFMQSWKLRGVYRSLKDH
jgi:phosphatidylglycerophosphate synthase